MKRDMNLIRNILLQIEAHETSTTKPKIDIDDVPKEIVSYHLVLLLEAELIYGAEVPTPTGAEVLIERLTWKGHEFLDAAKSDKVWNRAIKKITEQVGSAPISILQSLLTAYLRAELNI